MGYRKGLLRTLCLGCSVLIASPTWAATIEPGLGDVSVNHGRGFSPVNSRSGANVGDSVMVGPGGTATIVYEDGCRVDVRPGAVTTIAPLSPCASGSYAQDQQYCGPDNPDCCPRDQAGHPVCGPDGAPIAFGVVVAGALGAAIWAATLSP